jgi:integrase
VSRRGLEGPGFNQQKRRGMAVWMIDFLYLDKQNVEQRFRRKAKIQSQDGAKVEAKRRKLVAMQCGNPDGVIVEQKAKVPTFSEFWRDYFLPVYMETRCSPSTRERYKVLWKQIEPAFGLMRMDKITYADWDRFVLGLNTRRQVFKNGRADRVGVQTRPHEVFLAGLLKVAKKRAKVIAKLPFKMELSKRRKNDERDVATPSEEQVAAMLSRPPEQRTWIDDAVLIAAFTGARMGEIRALRRKDLDFKAGVVRIGRAVSATVIRNQTKGGSGRVVPMHDEIRARFQSRLEMPEVLVIRRKGGAMPSRQAMLTAFYALQDSVKVCREEVKDEQGKTAYVRRFAFHALRSYFLTALMRHGAASSVAQLLAGHSKLATTQLYLRPEKSEQASAVARLPGPRR